MSQNFFARIGAVIKYVVSILLNISIIFNINWLVLYMYKAHPILHEDLPEIQEKLLVLCNRTGVPIPSLYVTELPLPGSFIAGKNPNETVLIFPKRLQILMKSEQIEAMLAHNIVQIDDATRLRTFVSLAASILTMTASAVRWGAVFTGFGDYNDPAPKLFGRFVMGLVAPPAATMVHLVSNSDFDAKAARLCGSRDALLSAIECLENNNVTGYPSLGFICLIDPQKESFFENLFTSHPSREKRIKNLTGNQK